MRILAFVGPKGSGKDTAAEYLRKMNILGGNIKFAAPLKTICSYIFNIPLDVFENPSLKEHTFKTSIELTEEHMFEIMKVMSEYVPYTTFRYEQLKMHIGMIIDSPRTLLQYIGTDIIRNIDNNWHINAAFSKKALEGLSDKYIHTVTDVRFLNEYEYIKNLGGKFVYIEREANEIAMQNSTHPSEKEIMLVKEKILKSKSLIIKNNGSVEDLHNILLNEIGKKHFLDYN